MSAHIQASRMLLATANGKVVLSGSDFFEAQMDFSSINTVANNVKYSTGDTLYQKTPVVQIITKLEQIGQQCKANQRRLILSERLPLSMFKLAELLVIFSNPSRILITQIFPLTTILHTIKGTALSRLKMDQVIITSGLPIQK